jgi:hypothetical protein
MRNSEFQSRRVVRSYRQTIDATPEVVFPLLCPVREAEWLDGWQYAMIYSVSGFVEGGAVFRTQHEGEEDTVWVVTRHDAAAHIVEFTRFTPYCKTCVLRISVEPGGEFQSLVNVCYSYTSIAPAGNEFLDSWSEDSFLEAVRFWESSMNYFLKTGSTMRRA